MTERIEKLEDEVAQVQAILSSLKADVKQLTRQTYWLAIEIHAILVNLNVQKETEGIEDIISDLSELIDTKDVRRI